MHPGIATILEAVKQHGPHTEAYKELGSIKASLHPNGQLLIFNYTDLATFEARWNEVEVVSRGLIIRWPTASLAALPFQKFFNLNENALTQINTLPAGPCEVTVKLDGSLGILYRPDGGYAISTRGNFISNQAIWATEYLNEHYDLTGLAADITLLFEIVYPENKIIVHYGETEALYLIGARRFDGYDYPYAELQTLGAQFGFPVVPSVQVASFKDLLPLVESSQGIEGWVVRFSNGLRVKVKTTEYIRITKILMGLTPKKMRDWLLAGGPDALTRAMQGLPEEIYQDMRKIGDDIIGRAEAEESRLRSLYEQLAPLALQSRRDFALTVRDQHLADSSYLFALIDHKPLWPLILKNIEL